jgi:glycosyltransferase involved in cell wall biosynthesis
LQIEHAPNRIFESVIRKPDTATVRFLFVGAFSQLKGLDLLATALDRLRQSFDFQVTLVGGPRSGFLDHVRQQTSPALWNQVEIKENLSSEEVAAEMARATALLFPTRVDTSPNAVKEAVVASSITSSPGAMGSPSRPAVQRACGWPYKRSSSIPRFDQAVLIHRRSRK